MNSGTGLAVALGLGSNLGAAPENIRTAVGSLKERGLTEVHLSSFYETSPVDCDPGTPPFINAALIGQWPGTPDELLRSCKQIEQSLGRPACHSSSAARIIDIDILLLNTFRLNLPGFTVPHPRLAQRLFVLLPLSEVAPGWIIPGTPERTVAEQCRLQLAITEAPERLVRKTIS